MRLFAKGTLASEVLLGNDLSNKTFLITGASSGLGFETCKTLIQHGAKVFVCARTADKAKQASKLIGENALPMECDLSKPESINSAINQINVSLDGIVACAGVMALPDREIVHGIESQMFVNHIGHFILINGLLDRLKPQASVVVVSSGAHSMARNGIPLDDLAFHKNYRPWAAYGRSKLANILFSNELARRLQSGQTSNALHPGIVDTRLWRHLSKEEMTKMLGQSKLHPAEECAASIVYLSAHPDAKTFNGEYISNGTIGKASRMATDKELARGLWEASMEFKQSISPLRDD